MTQILPGHQYRNTNFAKLPIVITRQGEYVTRQGKIVRIFLIDRHYAYGVYIEGGSKINYDISGRTLAYSTAGRDIIRSH